MRLLVILAGLALGVGLFAGAPARAATVGCACNKIGANPVCTATIEECNKTGGVCLWTCAYEPAKKAKGKKKKM
jgi:hypothetical protein